MSDYCQKTDIVFNAVHTAVITCKKNHEGQIVITLANRAAQNLASITSVEAVGKTLEEACPLLFEHGIKRHIMTVLEANKSVNTAIIEKDTKQINRWLELEISLMPAAEVLILIENITEQKQLEGKLRRQIAANKLTAEVSYLFANMKLENFRDTMYNMLQKIGEFYGVDRSYIFTIDDSNQTKSMIFEWCATAVQPQQHAWQDVPLAVMPNIMAIVAQHELKIIYDVDKEVPEISEWERQKNMPGQYQNILAMVVLSVRDNEGKMLGIMGMDIVLRDMVWEQEELTVLKIAANLVGDGIKKHCHDQELHQLSYSDKLTGLYNRAFFDAELQRLDTERQIPISIIMADVNGLKLVNDAFGHKYGDQLLQKVADSLRKVFRQEEIICRWGGDEFAILLPRVNYDVTEKKTSKLKEILKKIMPDPIHVSVALGHATKTEMHMNINEVLRDAESSMYNNKLTESRIFRRKVFSYLTEKLATISKYEDQHVWRVQMLAIKLGEAVGLSETAMEDLIAAVAMHDLGKVTLPEHVMLAQRPLNHEDQELYKKHVESSYHITVGYKEYAHLAPIVLAHHENWDGSGYPQQLIGKDIPYLARIIRVVDYYDAICNDERGQELSRAEALQVIKQQAGKKLDPDIVEVFIGLDFKEGYGLGGN